MAKIYTIENKHQMETVREHLRVNSGQLWVNMFDLMVSSDTGEISSLLKLEVEHVSLFLSTGVIVWNMSSGRSSKQRQTICPMMRNTLENQLKIAHGKKYLFEASLTQSNRCVNRQTPITRQTAWNRIKQAHDAVRRASLDAGVTRKVNVTPQSLMGTGVNIHNVSVKLTEVVAMFGGVLSEHFMDEVRREIARLESMSQM